MSSESDSIDEEEWRRRMYDIRGTSHGSDRSDTIGSGSVLDEDIFVLISIIDKSTLVPQMKFFVFACIICI